MTVEVGRRFPLHAGSSSTCILAFLPDGATGRGPGRPARRADPAHGGGARLRCGTGSRRSSAPASRSRTASARRAPAPSPRRCSASTARVQGAVSVCGPADRVDRRCASASRRSCARPRTGSPGGWAGAAGCRSRRSGGGTMSDALAGLKVLDVSTLFAGPLAATMLGDFGADVIKVEHPPRRPGARATAPARTASACGGRCSGATSARSRSTSARPRARTCSAAWSPTPTS